MGKIGSVYDLMEMYIKNQDNPVNNHKLETLEITLNKIAEHGVNYLDVKKYLLSAYNIDPTDIFLNTVSNKRVIKNNILRDSTCINLDKRSKVTYKKRYHNELRIYPKASTVSYDINTGELSRDTEKYFLEYKYSYTIEDLLKYYLSKEYLYNKNTVDEKRFMIHLTDLVRRYGVENVLFMIDASESYLETLKYKTLNNPYGIVDQYNLAMEIKDRKKSEIIASGCDKIVPRKRLLLN